MISISSYITSKHVCSHLNIVLLVHIAAIETVQAQSYSRISYLPRSRGGRTIVESSIAMDTQQSGDLSSDIRMDSECLCIQEKA